MLFYALTGSCIHEAERNVELLLSTGRISFDQEPGGWRSFRGGNSPMSMCCEGNHSPSRVNDFDIISIHVDVTSLASTNTIAAVPCCVVFIALLDTLC